jgi:glucose-6-phosphate 1-dehydrogenase
MAQKYVIIVGGTGDLARTKLYPAITELYTYHYPLDAVQFIAAGRNSYTQEEFRAKAKTEDNEIGIDHIIYEQIRFDTVEDIKVLYQKYAIQDGDECVWYLAIPPHNIDQIIDTLSQVKTQYSSIRQKIIFEKPFGNDIHTAKQLNIKLKQSFEEKEIYRIDHYLGKETVQNILALRFGNTMYEPLLNNRYVESISINVWEQKGIGSRAAYFDTSGIVKDILQNHIIQLVCLITMESPVRMEAEFIRDEKHKVLRSLRPIDCSDVTIGQYIGYTQEEGVPEDSQTETYINMTTYIDNLRWNGVPIRISTGKSLAEAKAEIKIVFKPTFEYFVHQDEECNPQKNELVIQIQPNEEVYSLVNAKFPGKGMCIQPVKLNFTYQETFGKPSQGAYTRLIQDILEEDQSLFIRADEIESAWEYVSPLIETHSDKRNLVLYPIGSNPDTIQK